MNMSAQSEPARTSAGKVVLAGLILCIGTTVFGTDIVVRPKTTEAHLRNPGMGFIYSRRATADPGNSRCFLHLD